MKGCMCMKQSIFIKPIGIIHTDFEKLADIPIQPQQVKKPVPERLKYISKG